MLNRRSSAIYIGFLAFENVEIIGSLQSPTFAERLSTLGRRAGRAVALENSDAVTRVQTSGLGKSNPTGWVERHRPASVRDMALSGRPSRHRHEAALGAMMLPYARRAALPSAKLPIRATP